MKRCCEEDEEFSVSALDFVMFAIAMTVILIVAALVAGCLMIWFFVKRVVLTLLRAFAKQISIHNEDVT